MQSRYYSPTLQRLINADAAVNLDEDLLAHNLFTYCLNDPINRSDESGSWSLPNWAKVAIGAALVVTAAVVATVATGGVACFAAGAAIGAAKGAVSGAIGGAVTGVISNRIRTGSWEGSLEAAVDGAADGFMYGAVSGFIMGGLSSKACFVAGTLISAAHALKPIETIQSGEFVWAEDPETGERALKRVVRTFLNEKDELVHVQVNGETITCTTEHPFYVRGKGWVAAEELKISDKLELQNGANAFIEAVRHEKLETPIQVYNFEVEDFHTYYVGSDCVLVHNACARRGANNPKVADAARKGREVHKSWDYGPGVQKEVTIRGILNNKEVTRRVDGLNVTKRIIYELKPNNSRAVARGVKQLNDYATILKGNWEKVLIKY